jgi:glyoxylase-like metal-dependent hydrolase (beta-lactamase superfamily II)
MATLEHLNAGWLRVPPYPPASCHCVVLRDSAGVTLIDTGIGLEDVRNPLGRIGQQLIDLAGFQFNADDTALRQLERRGIGAHDVKHIVLTHLDPDHAGGLADFPLATVHLSLEELRAMRHGDPRYLPIQFAHGPRWKTYSDADGEWFGFEARRLDIGLASPVLLIPLFGHTAGHCGVAMQQGSRWALHVGDAYYLRGELVDEAHPVGQLAAVRAVDNARRLDSLERLRRLVREHGNDVEVFGYHDVGELPPEQGGSAAA